MKILAKHINIKIKGFAVGATLMIFIKGFNPCCSAATDYYHSRKVLVVTKLGINSLCVFMKK